MGRRVHEAKADPILEYDEPAHAHHETEERRWLTNTWNSGTAVIASRERACPWTPWSIPSRSGDSPETIRRNFPSLTLEQVYGSIAFCLAHETGVDANIREGEAELERLITPLGQSRPELYARLQRAREHLAKH